MNTTPVDISRELIDRIQMWSADQADSPALTTAVSRILELGLATSGKGQVHISHGEALLIGMMKDIYDHFEIRDGEGEPAFALSSIFNGHLWGLDWRYGLLSRMQPDEESVLKETVDILDMWRRIQWSCEQLSKDDWSYIEGKIEKYNIRDKFPGFDGNQETEHYSIAIYLVEKLGRFREFDSRMMNSHSNVLGRYRRMLNILPPVEFHNPSLHLSRDDLIALWNA